MCHLHNGEEKSSSHWLEEIHQMAGLYVNLSTVGNEELKGFRHLTHTSLQHLEASRCV